MKLTSTLIALLAASPALAHPSLAPHQHHEASTFSPMAAGIALGVVAVAVVAAPYVRAALSRVTAR